jgi:gamma-glutamylcyclotransferase (GGCT)/AIG2-like uncharacterized protein YtfP
MPLLFSYGTLQEGIVQLDTFGRLLQGQPDELPGYEPGLVKVEGAQYANVVFSGKDGSRVKGIVFEVTEAELAAADGYEEDAGYKRVVVVLSSGKEAWVYVAGVS